MGDKLNRKVELDREKLNELAVEWYENWQSAEDKLKIETNLLKIALDRLSNTTTNKNSIKNLHNELIRARKVIESYARITSNWKSEKSVELSIKYMYKNSEDFPDLKFDHDRMLEEVLCQ